MMKPKNNLLMGIIVIMALIVFTGCIQQQKPKTELPAIQIVKTELPAIQIVYSIGSGWTGESMILTINHEGSVVSEEQPARWEENDTKTIKSIQLSNEELQEVKTLIINSSVFDYKDSYNCESNCPTDIPYSSIKFVISGNEKTVSMYAPRDMPESLKQILEKINSIEKKFQ